MFTFFVAALAFLVLAGAVVVKDQRIKRRDNAPPCVCEADEAILTAARAVDRAYTKTRERRSTKLDNVFAPDLSR